MQAIILCGGLATLLSETTKRIPKVLLNIGDMMVLDWQLQLLTDVGVKEIILASGLWMLQTDANWIDIGVPERLVYARQHFR